jgi:hypothetical protein
MYAGWRQYFGTTRGRDHALGGTTTRARLTLLDTWPDANETSHGRSLPLGEVLAARSSVSPPFLVKIFSTNQCGNLLLFDDPSRVRSQITTVVWQIQRFDFDCNLVECRHIYPK